MLFNTKKLDPRYNNSSAFQIALFSLNTAAATLYMALMEYTAYFVNGIIGFGVVFTSIVLTGLRVFDGLIDPFIGYIVDRTEGKYGKFRPFMVLGNFLMAISSLLLYYCSYTIPRVLRLPIFLLIYVLFVIGYTFQMLVAKAGQTVMTNNPKMRPLSTYFDSLFITSSYGGTALYAQSYLTKKYGGFQDPRLYQELTLWIVLIGGICTICAVFGIWSKDRKEYFGNSNQVTKIKVKDYFSIIKHNKPIRMLVTAASVNKFTSMVYSNITVGVIIFGIMMKNYELSGQIGLVTAIPNLIVVTIGVMVAQRLGQKKAFESFTWLAIVFQIFMTFLLVFGDLPQIGLTKWNTISILFFGVFILLNGCKAVSNNIVVPMIADCSDYEVYRSGNYVPGIMGALFSLIDQVVSAFGTAFVGLIVAMIGFRYSLPQIDDKLTSSLKMVAILCYCVIPIGGWLLSLRSMRYYELDKERMREINLKNSYDDDCRENLS